MPARTDDRTYRGATRKYHFHAKYAGQRAAFGIQDLRIIEGRLSPRAVSLVLEWAFRHREELLENWRRIERREELLKIDPLD